MRERVRLPGYEIAYLEMYNEEYVLYLLAVPGHVGPTMVRYPGSHVNGSVGTQVDFLVITAQNRL